MLRTHLLRQFPYDIFYLNFPSISDELSSTKQSLNRRNLPLFKSIASSFQLRKLNGHSCNLIHFPISTAMHFLKAVVRSKMQWNNDSNSADFISSVTNAFLDSM